MTARGMVLAPHSPVTGEVETHDAWLGGDARIPTPLRSDDGDYFREEHPPRVVAHHLTCTTHGQRHLWDIVESTITRDAELPGGDFEEVQEFRSHLTCVRCGLIQQWAGERRERKVGQVDPQPLVAGDLAAQMVRCTDLFGGRDASTWVIYRGGRPVGSMTWGSGARGRAFHTARLEEWPAGEHVEGSTPVAAFRKLARRLAAVPA